jgi:hypothetical protein
LQAVTRVTGDFPQANPSPSLPPAIEAEHVYKEPSGSISEKFMLEAPVNGKGEDTRDKERITKLLNRRGPRVSEADPARQIHQAKPHHYYVDSDGDWPQIPAWILAFDDDESVGFFHPLISLTAFDLRGQVKG